MEDRPESPIEIRPNISNLIQNRSITYETKLQNQQKTINQLKSDNEIQKLELLRHEMDKKILTKKKLYEYENLESDFLNCQCGLSFIIGDLSTNLKTSFISLVKYSLKLKIKNLEQTSKPFKQNMKFKKQSYTINKQTA